VRRQRESDALSGLPATPLWYEQKRSFDVVPNRLARAHTKAASPVVLIRRRTPSAAALQKGLGRLAFFHLRDLLAEVFGGQLDLVIDVVDPRKVSVDGLKGMA